MIQQHLKTMFSNVAKSAVYANEAHVCLFVYVMLFLYVCLIVYVTYVVVPVILYLGTMA